MTELRRTYNRKPGRTSGGREYRNGRPVYRETGGGPSGKRKRPKGSPIFYICLLMALAVLAAGAFVLFRKFGPGTTWADYKTVYGMGADGTAVFHDGIQTESAALSRNGKLYLPADAAAETDSKWYFSDEGLLLYSLATETVSIQPGSHTYAVGGQTTDMGYEICFTENGKAYISVDFMAAFTGVQISSYPSDQESGLPARLYLENDWGTHLKAEASGKTAIRVLAGIKSPILTETEKGSTLYIIDTVDDWTRVRTEDGFVGYLKTKYLKNQQEYQLASSAALPEYTAVKSDKKISMAWHQVFSAGDNAELSEYLEGTEGITVLSPTWFSVADNSGALNSLADASYVSQAHERGMQVWGLVDDFDSNVDVLTLLSSSAARRTMADQLMNAVSQYGLDGINVDFEGIKQDSAPHFLQFIRELSIACRQAGKVLSIDNYVPSGGRSWYDLEEQGQVADYVVIMGYDEHYKGCCSGTNASLSFSEQGIVNTLRSVPAEKVINGLPFFMRVWQETPEENAPEDAKLYDDGLSVYEGRYARDSRAVGMDEAQRLLSAHGVTPEWKEKLGQYYGQYEEDGSTWRIWLEDARSIGLKMEKVKQYGIAGAAFWKLGLESSDVWPVIGQYLQ